jgi:diguanylate cyclase (GGDEF)-like protein/PAS domain S-box-containing protein
VVQVVHVIQVLNAPPGGIPYNTIRARLADLGLQPMRAKAAPPIPNEALRLASLHGLQVLDTLPEQVFDDIVQLASHICGTPIALVSLVDSERQWFKARLGMDAEQTHRSLSFCAHAIGSAEPVFVVEDTLQDQRFSGNALVTGEPHIRSYAGAPIVMPDGSALGTVCVIDTVARTLSAGQLGALQALARQTAVLLQARRDTLASEQQSHEQSRLAAQAAAERAFAAELLELALRGGDLGLWDMHVPSGRTTVNLRACAMLGYTTEEVASGEPAWHELMHAEDRPLLHAALARHLAGETAYYECELRMRHKHGHWVWLLSRAVVVERSAAGMPLRIVGTHTDIDQRVAESQAKQHAADLQRRMATLAQVGGWELELGTGKISWTDEVYRIHEVAPGTPLALLSNIDFYAPHAQPVITSAIEEAIEHGTPWDLELDFITATGRPRVVRAQGEAVFKDGKVLRLFGAFQDITERKQIEQALQLSEQRLNLALSSTRLAVFDWDIASGRVHRGANLSVLRGGPAAETDCGIADVQALIHPADLLSVWTTTRAALRGETASYDFEHRVRRLDGGWLWVRAVGRVTERSPNGRALRVSGIDEDVTARKAAEHALVESQRRLRTIADNLPAMIALVDHEQRYRFLNAHIERLFGIDSETALGRTMREVRGEATYATLAPHVAAALQGENASFVYSELLNGQLHHYQSNYIPDVDTAGSVRGFYAMTFDITEMQDTQHRLELLARVDALTGLPNRRQLDERIADAMSRKRRTTQSLAVVFLDIDHFKSINDSLGHASGDLVLCEFAKRLRGCVRTTDTVARLAGDEFVLLLESIDSDLDVISLANKIVACIRPPFQVAGKALAVTTSAGVAIYQGGAQTAAELLARADGALYQAKKLGRDRFALA